MIKGVESLECFFCTRFYHECFIFIFIINVGYWCMHETLINSLCNMFTILTRVGSGLILEDPDPTRTRKIGLLGPRPGPEKRPGEVLPFVFINIVKKHCFLCTHLPLLVPLPNNWLLFYNKHWGGGVTASVCFQDIYKWTSQTISSGTWTWSWTHSHQHFWTLSSALLCLI